MKDKRMTIYQMTTTALMTAVLCVLGPISVPIGAVPVSFTMVAVYFAVYVLGAKYATISTLLYLVIGSIGLPVFSGYEGGLAKLAGPTGGYLIGFAVIAVIAGIIIDHFGGKIGWSIVGMVLGLAVCYLLGTIWFVVQSGYTVQAALTACVYPFLAFDAVKIVFAAMVGPMLRTQLQKAHLLPAR